MEEDSRRALALDDALVKVIAPLLSSLNNPSHVFLMFLGWETRDAWIDLQNMCTWVFEQLLIRVCVCLRDVTQGHYLLGCALLEKEDCALAVKEFDKVCHTRCVMLRSPRLYRRNVDLVGVVAETSMV